MTSTAKKAAVAVAATAALVFGAGPAVAADAMDGYKGMARTLLWSPGPIEFYDASRFKKDPPYVI